MNDKPNYSWPDPEDRSKPEETGSPASRESRPEPEIEVTVIRQVRRPQKSRSGKRGTFWILFSLGVFFVMPIALVFWPGVSAIHRFILPIPVGELGKPVSYGGHTVTVNQVERTALVDRQTPKTGFQFVLVDITYESGGDENISSTLFFEPPRLKDNQGYLYESQSDVRKPGLRDTSGVLTKGTKVRGWLTFQVPTTAEGLLLDLPVTRGFDRRNPIRMPILLDAKATANAPTFSGQVVGSSGKVGQQIGQGSYLLLVNSALVNEQIQVSSGNFRQAASSKKFVLLELIFESKSDSGVFVNGSNATLKDDGNFAYKTSGGGFYEPALPVISNLPKGYKVRGWISFEIPNPAKGLVLEYRSNSGEKVTLQVALDA